MTSASPLVGLIMGSQSDWPTMLNTASVLDELGVSFRKAHYFSSSHSRTPLSICHERLETEGLKVIIAGAGGAAHLPGMTAALTELPVLGVPIKSSILSGRDSLLSIVQMPAGIAVGTLAIGDAGASNAGSAGGSNSCYFRREADETP